MKFVSSIIFAALLSLVLFTVPTQADHNRFLPALPTATQLRVLARGYGLFCVNNDADAYPNFINQMVTVYNDEYSGEFGGHGVGIQWYESLDGSECDIIHDMVPESAFPCGSGASACTYYTNDPVIVYYDEAMLYSDWKTAIGHEHGHWDGSHERYIDSGGRIICDPTATYTRNSCSTGVWWVTAYDQIVAWNTMVPDAPMTLSTSISDGWMTVRWDKYRKDCSGLPQSVLDGSWTNLFPGAPAHPTCENDVATRMTYGHADCDGCPIDWIGNVCGAALNYCYSDFSDYQRSFDAYWRGCVYVHVENAALSWVPQVSAPNFWTLAGCW